MRFSKQIGNKLGEGLTLNNIGGNYTDQGKYSEAEKPLFAAIDIWELLRNKLTDDQKISILEQYTSNQQDEK